jgi:hypothetical protein
MSLSTATLLAIGTLFGIVISALVLLALVALSRWGQARHTPRTQIEPALIRSHLPLLPDNDVVNWYRTREAVLPPQFSRRLNPHLPELVPGPLILPLRPQETLLYADDLGDMVEKQIDQLQTKPVRTLAS